MRMPSRRRRFPFSPGAARTLLALSLALGGLAGQGAAWAQQATASPTPQQQRFREIYKELIEINTRHRARTGAG